jgi:hypothetical protein
MGEVIVCLRMRLRLTRIAQRLIILALRAPGAG